MRFFLAVLLLLLSGRQLLAQDDTVVVAFDDLPCTEEQRAAGAPGSPDEADSLTAARLDPPHLNAPIPDYNPLAMQNRPTYWSVRLTFVVDTTGFVDRCTVRIVENNEPRWTMHVLEHLAKIRCRPAFDGPVPCRLLIAQRFTMLRRSHRRRAGSAPAITPPTTGVPGVPAVSDVPATTLAR